MNKDKPPGKKPDYYLKVNTSDGDSWDRAGCAWQSADGVISVTFNKGFSIKWNDDLKLILVPNEKKHGTENA